MADLYLVFKEASILFSSDYTSFAFLPAVYEGSFFPTSSPTPVVVGVFDDGCSKRDEVESYCGFGLHFLYG
jgi:hypothetical protein